MNFFTAFEHLSAGQVAFWLALLILLPLKATAGDQKFFSSRFGNRYADSRQLSWNKWLYHHVATFILFFLVPLWLIYFCFDGNFARFGLQVGDWKFGAVATLAAVIILPALLYLNSKNKEHLRWYPLTDKAFESKRMFVFFSSTYLLHYIGWEFFFRGFIGMGASAETRVFTALMLQVLLSTLLHIGKPAGELWSGIPGAIYLGLLANRTGSILWPLLFHFYLGIINTYFCHRQKQKN